MKFTSITLLVAFYIASCGEPGLNQHVNSTSRPMTDFHSTGSSAASGWTEFLRVLREIDKIKSLNQLNSAQDLLDPWRSMVGGTKEELDDVKERESVRKNQLYILNDELQRKKSKLRNKPGRQRRTDWLVSLSSHSDRLQAELDLVNKPIVHTPGLRQLNLYLQESISLSDQLLDADINQVTERLKEGEYSNIPDIDQLLENAKSLRNRSHSLGR